MRGRKTIEFLAKYFNGDKYKAAIIFYLCEIFVPPIVVLLLYGIIQLLGNKNALGLCVEFPAMIGCLFIVQ
jgi:hypothetical protein